MMLSEREIQLGEELRLARLEIQLLKVKLDALARRVFGKSSEKLDGGQLQLLLEGLEEIAQVREEAKSHGAGGDDKKRPGERRPRIPEHLPVKEVIIEPEEVQASPQDWVCIGEEVTEQLDYTPASFTRLRLIRRKYVHRTQKELPPIIAPLSPTLQERCIAAPSLLAHAMVSRYRDHLPWYRLEGIYAGLGVAISRQSLCNWSGMAADASRLVVEEIKAGVFADGYVQIDETPIEYLVPGNGQTRTGYLWVVHNPQRREALFTWHTSRAAACLHSIVPPTFQGIIQCDGYSAYDAFARSRSPAGSLRLAGCWAHARRAFFEAREHTKDAAWVLGQIQLLYGIEAELREPRAGPEARHATRQAQSRPLIEALHHYLTDLQIRRVHLPQSLMGKATRYALNQWESLGVYLEDGRVEIDSNGVENAIRPSALGKKNWLFVGDAQAGARAATFYTLMANCRAHAIDPYAYLKDLFTRLPALTNRQVHTITPSAWAGQRQTPQPASSARSDATLASTP
jgi:transposase